MDGKIITQISNINFLGVKINEFVSWKPHIDDLCNRLRRITGVLRRLKFTLPSHVMISLYNPLIFASSHLLLYDWGGGTF